jgi:hypothetical protein
MTKFGYPDANKDSIGEEGAHSLLKIKRKVDDVEKYIFYIIPSQQEELFVKIPKLVDTSLNAKAFYQVEVTLYDENSASYNNDINQRFDYLTGLMGVVTDSTLE